MTKALQSKLARAYAKQDKAIDAVYAAAYPRREVVFSECLKLASEAARDAYRAAVNAHDEIERDAIAKGYAWRASFGLLMWR